MGLKILKIDGYNPTNSLRVALEKEDSFSNDIKSKSFVERFTQKALRYLIKKLGAAVPVMYFEYEDIDPKVVQQLLAHPELLEAVIKWIEEIDYSVLPKLVEAKKVFERIQRPKRRDSKLYRSFDLNSGQQTLGLDKENKNVKVGERFNFLPDRPLSFSAHHATTSTYGKNIVSIDYSKEDKRIFHITNEIFVAAIMHAEKFDKVEDAFVNGKMYSYFESVFLPDGKSLEFTLMSKK